MNAELMERKAMRDESSDDFPTWKVEARNARRKAAETRAEME